MRTGTVVPMEYVRMSMGESPFWCSYPECKYRSKASQQIKQHVGTHVGPFSCNFGDCKYKCSTTKQIVRHVKEHIKSFSCNFGDCEYKCSTPRKIVAHVERHIDPFRYPCTFPGCDFRSAYKGGITSHMKTHSPEGQISRKKQEYRVNKLLKKWGYTADLEVTINASKDNCVQDTHKHYAKLDFTIVNCVNAILILEIDENQHYWYNLSCEFSRMSNVRASLMKAGYELPIYWIRYSPTGNYHVGAHEVEFSRSEREDALKAKLDKLCSPDFVPEHQVHIHYMFYDLISEQAGPKIMTDYDFPAFLKECVSWCFVPKQPKMFPDFKNVVKLYDNTNTTWRYRRL